MSIIKEINGFRRWLTHSLTGGIGNKNVNQSSLPLNGSIQSILVTRPNHRLGNLLLITPLLQELENLFPHAKIDVFLKGGLGPIILKEYKNINEIIALPKDHFNALPAYLATWLKLREKEYDLVINAAPDSSSGRLSTKLSHAVYKLYGENEYHCQTGAENYDHIAKLPVCFLRDAVFRKQPTPPTQIPPLSLKMSKEEIEKGKGQMENIIGSQKKVLAIFTYATGEKCHSKSWWKKFYTSLKAAFPEYVILEILPKENISQIDFEAPTYYSKDLREICGLLANTTAFVGADSGMMHLAVASGTPVIGLFNVTNPKKYCPYGGKNVAINTTQTPITEITGKLKTILSPLHSAKTIPVCFQN